MTTIEASEFAATADLLSHRQEAWRRQARHVAGHSAFYRALWDGKTPPADLRDLAWTGTDLAALVGDAIVIIGADGRAAATIEVSGQLASPRGLAVIGSSFYLLDETAHDEAVTYEVPMP